MGPPHPQPQHGSAQHNPAVLSSACDLFALHYIFQMIQPCAVNQSFGQYLPPPEIRNVVRFVPTAHCSVRCAMTALCTVCWCCSLLCTAARTSHNKPWAHFSPQAGLRCQLVSVKLPYIPCLAPCYTFYLYAHSYAFIGPLQNTVLCA